MNQTVFLDLTKTPLQIFSKNLAAISHIQQIVVEIRKGDVRKASEKTRYLLSSYIVFLISSWEAFIENSISYNVAKIKNNPQLLEKILETINMKHFTLSEYIEYTEKLISRFHTPTPKKIDELAKSILGIRKLSDHWQFNTMTTKAVSEKMLDIYRIRGALAHTGYTKCELTFEENYNYMEFLLCTAQQTEVGLKKYTDELI